MNRRTDEQPTRTYFRSDRFFAVGGQWFFTTRESGDQGPFESRALAEAALLEFLSTHGGRPNTGWDVPGARH
jgi:hypothetical protein